jgi:hypothetical protein
MYSRFFSLDAAIEGRLVIPPPPATRLRHFSSDKRISLTIEASSFSVSSAVSQIAIK